LKEDIALLYYNKFETEEIEGSEWPELKTLYFMMILSF
jgi:hypothetical protein